jgi:hypothetical protein
MRVTENGKQGISIDTLDSLPGALEVKLWATQHPAAPEK